MPWNRFRAVVLALLIFFVVPSAAQSQERQTFAKVCGYAGGSFVPTFTLDGETFDGLTYYQEVGGDEIAILPKLDKQMMFRAWLAATFRGSQSRTAAFWKASPRRASATGPSMVTRSTPRLE